MNEISIPWLFTTDHGCISADSLKGSWILKLQAQVKDTTLFPAFQKYVGYLYDRWCVHYDLLGGFLVFAMFL